MLTWMHNVNNYGKLTLVEVLDDRPSRGDVGPAHVRCGSPVCAGRTWEQCRRVGPGSDRPRNNGVTSAAQYASVADGKAGSGAGVSGAAAAGGVQDRERREREQPDRRGFGDRLEERRDGCAGRVVVDEVVQVDRVGIGRGGRFDL